MDEINDIDYLKKKKKEYQLYEGLAWGITIFLCLLAYFDFGLKMDLLFYLLAVVASVVADNLNKAVAGIREGIESYEKLSSVLNDSLEDDVTDLENEL